MLTLPPQTILTVVLNYYQNCYAIPPEVVFSRSRQQEVTEARHISYTLLKKYTPQSLKKIGKTFYPKGDHTYALYGIGVIRDRLQVDRDLRSAFETIESDLLSTLS